ncbi:hypothetical protein P879_10595 [Paragonimus westermani]|uniref:Uncharacterized protein n=1 Tax=Paragonimus westermani TaxID=34504 RepID=A0A8T0D5M7_9TREM|nr:hypothetical protein P879_10595 [Paragonimus westermani]
MSSHELLRLFATAIQNASALSTEMRFFDLNAAYKMTCELQQHIVGMIFSRKQLTHENILIPTSVKPEPDENLVPVLDTPLQATITDAQGECSLTSLMEPSNLTRQDLLENGMQSEATDTLSANRNTNGDSNNVDQRSPENVNHSSTYTSHRTPLSQLQSSGTGRVNRGVIMKRHRLVALETLHPDFSVDLTNSDDMVHQLPCASCRLRVNPGYEALASMACPACPGQPAICSAQCFRWWHSRLPKDCEHIPVDHEQPTPNQMYVNKLHTQASITRMLIPPQTSRPIRRPHRKSLAKRYTRSKSRRKAQAQVRRLRAQAVLDQQEQTLHSVKYTNGSPVSARGRKRKHIDRYSPVTHFAGFARRQQRLGR